MGILEYMWQTSNLLMKSAEIEKLYQAKLIPFKCYHLTGYK